MARYGTSPFGTNTLWPRLVRSISLSRRTSTFPTAALPHPDRAKVSMAEPRAFHQDGHRTCLAAPARDDQGNILVCAFQCPTLAWAASETWHTWAWYNSAMNKWVDEGHAGIDTTQPFPQSSRTSPLAEGVRKGTMRDWDAYTGSKWAASHGMPEWHLSQTQSLYYRTDWNWVPADYPREWPVTSVPTPVPPGELLPGSKHLLPIPWESSGTSSSRRKRKGRAAMPPPPTDVFIFPSTVSPSPHH